MKYYIEDTDNENKKLIRQRENKLIQRYDYGLMCWVDDVEMCQIYTGDIEVDPIREEDMQLELAKAICKQAHINQVDKGGRPYYLHPFVVAEMCQSKNEKTAAFLHDVIEDTDMTMSALRDIGFSDEIIIAVDRLTHKTGQDYEAYIKGVKSNKLARTVKINDMIHNSNLNRLSRVTDEDRARVEKYQRYIKYLKDA